MRKEQLIRICLAMLLVSTTLMLSSCKKDPKDKDPKEALVNTRWKMATDLPGLDIDKEIGEVSGGELHFSDGRRADSSYQRDEAHTLGDLQLRCYAKGLSRHGKNRR